MQGKDIKTNNVVLDRISLAEAEAVLIDFGKITELISPKVYDTPADIKKFKNLAPEPGKRNGRQSKKIDMYSVGFITCIDSAVSDLCKQFVSGKERQAST